MKVRATARAFELADRPVRAEPTAVDSGVAEQPWGHEETRRGAANRARRALATREAAALGVGMEGGVAELDGGLWLVMWGAVTDGERTAFGGGPSLRHAVAGALGPFVTDQY